MFLYIRLSSATYPLSPARLLPPLGFPSSLALEEEPLASEGAPPPPPPPLRRLRPSLEVTEAAEVGAVLAGPEEWEASEEAKRAELREKRNAL